MNIELRQWYFGDEERLINLYDHYDRSCCDINNPAPGECTKDTANLTIRHYVDMGYYNVGFARAIVLDGKVVGHIQYLKSGQLDEADCEVQIFLLPEACGRGVATEALKKMIDMALLWQNYESVHASIFDTNVAARRVAEKAGMQCCGIDPSGDATSPHKKLLYVIRRPRKELKNSGVELKPWEACDTDALARLCETADNRYDDMENPILACGYAHTEEQLASLGAEERHQRMLRSVRSNIDHWNTMERVGAGIYRAIANDGVVVGLISLRRLYGRSAIDGQLGYMMMPEHCGKGIATEAVRLMLDEVFSLPRLHRVSAHVYRPNEASSRVLEKNGFRLEAVQKNAVLCEGTPTDYLLYGLLRSEFEKMSYAEK